MDEVLVPAGLSPLQRHLYTLLIINDCKSHFSENESILNSANCRLFEISLQLQLQNACSHPYLLDRVQPQPFVLNDNLVFESGKLKVLNRMLKILFKNNHKVLVLSQSTSMLDILQDFCHLKKIPYERLDGSNRSVEQNLQSNASQSPLLFLLSTKSGSLNQNLSVAETVIFFDVDSNSAVVDQQIVERFKRISFSDQVRCFRILCKDTVEEAIWRRANFKVKLEQTTQDVIDIVKFGLSQITTVSDLTADSFELSDADLETLMSDNGDPDLGGYAPNMDQGHGWQKNRERDNAAFDNLRVQQQNSVSHDDVDEDDQIYGPRCNRSRPFGLEFDEDNFLTRVAATDKGNTPSNTNAQLWKEYDYTSCALRYDPTRPMVKNELTVCNEDRRAHFVTGSVTEPQAPDTESKIIVHIVDNFGIWGRGGIFTAINVLDPTVRERYELAGTMNDLKLGATLYFPIEGRPHTFAALIVAQKKERFGRIMMQNHLEEGLFQIALKAKEIRASVHLPRIGERLPDFDWYQAEKIISNMLVAEGVPTYIYYYSERTRNADTVSAIFDGCRVFFYIDNLPLADITALQRRIIAYGGEVSLRLDSSVTHIVTASNGSGIDVMDIINDHFDRDIIPFVVTFGWVVRCVLEDIVVPEQDHRHVN